MDKRIVERRELSATEERCIVNNIYAIAPGVWRMKDVFVNVFIIESQQQPGWVLIDTGLKSSYTKIKNMIGVNGYPKARTPDFSARCLERKMNKLAIVNPRKNTTMKIA